MKPEYAFMPWSANNPFDAYKRNKDIAIIESYYHGDKTLSLNEGSNLYGPVNELKGQLEFERLINITYKIINEGFKYNLFGQDITATPFLLSLTKTYLKTSH